MITRFMLTWIAFGTLVCVALALRLARKHRNKEYVHIAIMIGVLGVIVNVLAHTYRHELP